MTNNDSLTVTNYRLGLTPLLVDSTVRNFTCDGLCFEEFIPLEDMVKLQDTSRFCKPKYYGCERKNVNLNLPKNKNNFTTEDGKKTTDDDYFPTVPIVVTAILSIILTLSIVGIVLRVLRYLYFCYFNHGHTRFRQEFHFRAR